MLKFWASVGVRFTLTLLFPGRGSRSKLFLPIGKGRAQGSGGGWTVGILAFSWISKSGWKWFQRTEAQA